MNRVTDKKIKDNEGERQDTPHSLQLEEGQGGGDACAHAENESAYKDMSTATARCCSCVRLCVREPGR